MTTREETLTRIRGSLASGVLPVAKDVEQTAAAPASDQAALFTSFVREAQASGAEVFQPDTADRLEEILIELLRDAGQQAITWADEDLPIPHIRELLLRADVIRHVPQLARDSVQRRQTWSNLTGVRVGVTGALAGIADTGSIVVQSGPHRLRAASLLPETHIVLLSADRLYPTMAAFFAAHSARELTLSASNLVFITGPSRTADIEMIITRGVHGPKRLCVVLIPPPPSAASA
jgi:L-lactate dehydrogenase complex protein LldG